MWLFTASASRGPQVSWPALTCAPDPLYATEIVWAFGLSEHVSVFIIDTLLPFLAHDGSIGKGPGYQEAHEGKQSNSSVQCPVSSGELEEQWDEVDWTKDWSSSRRG